MNASPEDNISRYGFHFEFTSESSVLIYNQMAACYALQILAGSEHPIGMAIFHREIEEHPAMVRISIPNRPDAHNLLICMINHASYEMGKCHAENSVPEDYD